MWGMFFATEESYANKVTSLGISKYIVAKVAHWLNAGPFLGQTFLIVVDAYRKWYEAVPMNSSTSLSTIRTLMKIYATHGIPEQIVFDNGTQFTCSECIFCFCRTSNVMSSILIWSVDKPKSLVNALVDFC